MRSRMRAFAYVECAVGGVYGGGVGAGLPGAPPGGGRYAGGGYGMVGPGVRYAAAPPTRGMPHPGMGQGW